MSGLNGGTSGTESFLGPSRSRRPQQFPSPRNVPPAPTQFRSVVQKHFVFAMKPRLHLANRVQPHDASSVDSDKQFRVERFLERLQRPSHGMIPRSAMQDQVVAVCLDPHNAANGYEVRPVLFVDQQAISKRTLPLKLFDEA